MIRRYLLRFPDAILSVAGRPAGELLGHWMGVEIDSVLPLDVEAISQRTGRTIIHAENMSEDDLRSYGVKKFEYIGEPHA